MGQPITDPTSGSSFYVWLLTLTLTLTLTLSLTKAVTFESHWIKVLGAEIKMLITTFECLLLPAQLHQKDTITSLNNEKLQLWLVYRENSYFNNKRDQEFWLTTELDKKMFLSCYCCDRGSDDNHHSLSSLLTPAPLTAHSSVPGSVTLSLCQWKVRIRI